MESNIFSPRSTKFNIDTLSGFLQNLALGCLTLIFGLLPILFIPGVQSHIGFSKVFIVGLAILVSSIFLALSILRSGSIRFYVTSALGFFWLFTIIAIASAFLSGDPSDSLYGTYFEVHTAGFIVLMAFVMTISLSFSASKHMLTRLWILLGISAYVLQLYHLMRLIFGTDFLSFGFFNVATISPIGSFNDLAIFSGLIVLITLILLEKVRDSLLGKILFGSILVQSLIMLAVINFYMIWIILGFFSLVMLLYSVSKDTWLRNSQENFETISRFSLVVVVSVCVISSAFVLSGEYLGGVVSRLTGVNYLEVRPSLSSTLEIGKAVYSESALFGSGPNRFEDAWREYKNPIINQTQFWNTNFSSGNGFFSTLLVTTGIAGSISLLLFLGAYLYFGYRLLLCKLITDKLWYQFALLGFISAIYLWVMSIVYVPGVTILLLASMMTGLTFAIYIANKPEVGIKVNVTQNRQYGLLLIGAVLTIIISAGLISITVSKKFIAQVKYNEAVKLFQQNGDFYSVDNKLVRANELFNNDNFVLQRAKIRFFEMAKIAQSGDVSALSGQRYSDLLAEGIGLINQAIQLDVTNPINYSILIDFYSVLDPQQPEFSAIPQQVEEIFKKLRELDPKNPNYLFKLAQYKAQNGDLKGARTDVEESLKMKSDFTDALFVLSQIDVAEGKVDDAIKVVSAMVSLEPRNPTRYFQLGILLATANKTNEAVQAFETAIGLDNAYANARYFLALAYLDQNRKEDALLQLQLIKKTNPNNSELDTLINKVETDQYVKPTASYSVPVKSEQQISQDNDVTTTVNAPDTELVSPVNLPPAEDPVVPDIIPPTE